MAFEVARVHGLICSDIEDSLRLNNAMSLGERVIPEDRKVRRGVWTCLPSRIRVAYEPSLCGQSSEASSRSPLDSSASSTETESDDDDNELFASLAEEIAHSMLADDDQSSMKTVAGESKSSHDFSVLGDVEASELSMPTLSGLAVNRTGGSWLSASAPSSKGSSLVSSQVSSPPTTPSSEQCDAWDLLYSAAVEYVSLKTNDRRALALQVRVQQQQVHRLQQQAQARCKHQSVLFPRDRPATTGLHPQRSCSSLGRDEQRKPCWNQFQAAKTHSPTGWAQQSRLPSQLQQRSFLGSQNSSYDQSCNSLQQNAAAGYGVPAVFHGTGRAGWESSGTGVFLPRSLGNAPDKHSPYYPASTPPTRSLQLEISQAGSLKTCLNDHAWSPPDRKLHGSLLHQAAPAELSLPSEWTY